MPGRRDQKQRICKCSTCNGALVDETTWFAHQVPAAAASPLANTGSNKASIRPPPHSTKTWEPTPLDDIRTLPAQVTSEPPVPLATELPARRLKLSKKEAKREESRYTIRATGPLKGGIFQAKLILQELCGPHAQTHQALDAFQSQVQKLRETLGSVNRQTGSLAILKNELRRLLGEIEVLACAQGERLGERKEPIPCSIDLAHPGIPALMEVCMSLVMALMLYFGLSRLGCDFVLQVLPTLMVASVAATAGVSEMTGAIYAAGKHAEQLPRVMKTVLSKYNDILKDRKVIYACCPVCSAIYPPSYNSGKAVYPQQCVSESCVPITTCKTALLKKGQPIRPFILPSLEQHISKLLADKDLEAHIDKACTEALKAKSLPSTPSVIDAFHAEYLQTLKGPDGHLLFVNGGPNKEARIIFSLNVDWFNVFRSTNRGSSTSTGVMCLACLNLPAQVRYKAEHMFVAIIPGPKAPSDDQMNHFLRPLVDSIRASFYRGFLFAATANHPNGRIARSVVGPVVCDLPAARKSAGIANFNTNKKFCSVCNLSGLGDGYGRSDHPDLAANLDLCGIHALDMPSASAQAVPSSSGGVDAAIQDDVSFPILSPSSGMDSIKRFQLVYRDGTIQPLAPFPELPGWSHRSVPNMRTQALVWQGLPSNVTRAKLWDWTGVRYSELWRLPPYWNPVRQLVIDPMHALLEGVVQNHFRVVLQLSEEFSSKPGQVFSMGFEVDELDVAAAITRINATGNRSSVEKIKADATRIVKHLTAPVDHQEHGQEGSAQSLSGTLAKYNKMSLYIIAEKLQILSGLPHFSGFKGVSCAQLASNLVAWRLDKRPLRADKFIPDNLSVLTHVRKVIQETDVPSWVPYVPKDWGSAAMGTPKADEWRTMATIYFPLALISLWGGSITDAESKSRRQLLDLTMCVVQATWIACSRGTNNERRARYLKCMCTYLENLPRVVEHAKYRPNHHMSLHIYDFLKWWGPVHSWWTFPFERINGMLQRISTSNIFGELEITMSTVFSRRANFKLWLSRVANQGGLSEEMERFKHILYKMLDMVGWADPETVALTDSDEHPNQDINEPPLRGSEQARCHHNGVTFSRESAHVGNSLIAFEAGQRLRYGTIQQIRRLKSGSIVLDVTPYLDLADGQVDYFSPYSPDFPAACVSSEVGNPQEVSLAMVKCHCARYRLSSKSQVMVRLSKAGRYTCTILCCPS